VHPGDWHVEYPYVIQSPFKGAPKTCHGSLNSLLLHTVGVAVNMFLRTAFLSLSALVAAKEMPKDEVKAAKLYDSGIRHANNIALKKVANPSRLAWTQY
jgi:hypothetical protein